MTQIFTQNLAEARDVALVGGKAANLGTLLRARFPVPGGFVVTTAAYASARTTAGPAVPEDIAQTIRTAYRAMGAGVVAVRSSATAEDLGNASMAGQYETFLNIEGEENLLQTIERCWESLHTPRTLAYLREQGIDAAAVKMAVVIQRLIPADVAGVLFTAHPSDAKTDEMILEAVPGLGEALVSGQVQPDVLHLENQTGRILSSRVATSSRTSLTIDDDKSSSGRQPGASHTNGHPIPCLNPDHIHHLWQLGRRVADHFRTPQDIEWAIRDGNVFLLQSRPITTRRDAECYEELLRTTRQTLKQESTRHGPWVLHNLAETLAHPTPLTWSILRPFMSASGGFGNLYRQAGFAPSAALNETGFLENIAGRIYMDAASAPEMFTQNFPYAYDLYALKQNPGASQSPPTLPRGSLAVRLKAGRLLRGVTIKLRALAQNYDRELRTVHFPDLAVYVKAAKAAPLATLSTLEFLTLWQAREHHVLNEFAPHSLMPGLISALALEDLRLFLQEHFWHEDPAALAQFLSSGGPVNRTIAADADLFEVAKGRMTVDAWMQEHGHRAAGEFDLATPRWRERPWAVQELAQRLAHGQSPLDRQDRNAMDVKDRINELHRELSPSDQKTFDHRLDLLRRYLTFREDGKDYFMRGYDLLRDLALEAGRRLNIADDVFYLTKNEIVEALRAGSVAPQKIEHRKRVHRAQARLTLPRLIDAAEIHHLGELPPLPKDARGFAALSISLGQAAGPARIVQSATEAAALGTGYILVCPSTDPSWTPLFVNAAGLVLERGGTLSHGAVVAREMGLPAVVLPDATRLFADGEEIIVDGRRGWVCRAADAASETGAPETFDPQNTSIAPKFIPPPPGKKDRQAARTRNIFGAFWLLFLLVFFLGPKPWAYHPALALADALLWPVVRALGKPATVAVVAGAIAALTLLIQKLLTDNPRLLEAKRRAALLRKQSLPLPADSPRRAALLRAAAPVQGRVLLAALVPIGILLGPMIIPFLWFQTRLDPSVPVAPPGSPVQIVASIDGNWTQPVALQLPPHFTPDASTPPSRTLPPIRQTLDHLLTLYRQPPTNSADPSDTPPDQNLSRQQTAADLQAYLAAGIPPQGITWLITSPPNAAGKFRLTLTAPGHAPLTLTLVLGNQDPPATATVTGSANSPLKEFRIVYPRPAQEPYFFKPFHSLANSNFSLAPRLAALDISWLWLYIISYLPALFIVRALLRVA